jgi:hypothetical protein
MGTKRFDSGPLGTCEHDIGCQVFLRVVVTVDGHGGLTDRGMLEQAAFDFQ